MTEMIIVSVFFLVPLFLFMTMIVKFLDMRAATLQASRYAAFERTIYSATATRRDASMAQLTDAQLKNSIDTRFFSDGAGTINNGQYSAAMAPRAFWSDAGGRTLVNSGSDVQETSLNPSGAEPGTPGFLADNTLKDTLGNWNNLVPSALTGLNGFSLSYHQYYNLQVSVTPAKPQGKILGQLPSVSFKDHDALLADGWSASDIAYEKEQAKREVPTNILSFFNNPVFSAFLSFAVPDLGDFNSAGGGPQFGYVMVDKPGAVPADRLANYTPPTNPGGSQQVPQAEIDQFVKQYESQGFTYHGPPTTNSDNTVTLTFTKDGTTTTVTLGGSNGPKTTSTKTIDYSSKTVYQATQYTLGQLQNQGWSLNSLTYTCNGQTCPKYTSGKKKGQVNNTLADKATATLTKTTTFNKVSTTTTMNLTVTPLSSGGSQVTQSTTS